MARSVTRRLVLGLAAGLGAVAACVVLLVGWLLWPSLLEARRPAPSVLPGDGLLFRASGGGVYVASFDGAVSDPDLPSLVHPRFSRLRTELHSPEQPLGSPGYSQLYEAVVDGDDLVARGSGVLGSGNTQARVEPCGELRTTRPVPFGLHGMTPLPDGSGTMLSLSPRSTEDGGPDDLAEVVALHPTEAAHVGLGLDPVAHAGLSLHPDGRRLAVVSAAGNVEVLDLEGGAPVPVAPGHWPVWSPSGTQLAFLQDRAVRLYEPVSGSVQTAYEVRTRLNTFFESRPSWSSDDRFLSISYGTPGLGELCEVIDLVAGTAFRVARRSGTCGPFVPPEWMAERKGRCDDPVTRLE